jgi:ParB-like nuclease family protein
VSEFASFPGTDTAAESPRGFREGLPPAFRMRADAHYVEQLDGATPAATIQYIAAHAIDVSDAAADALPALVESIKRHGVLEPLVIQRKNGTYKTITGRKRLAAARAAGLRDVPCLVHHVSDERAEALRDLLQPLNTAPAPGPQPVQAPEAPAVPPLPSLLDLGLAAMRLVASAPDGNVAVVKTAAGARLTVDLPFSL